VAETSSEMITIVILPFGTEKLCKNHKF